MPSPALRLAHLTHSYRRGTRALDDLSATTTARRIVVLGPNGAGKSTLFSVLAGRLRAQHGTVLLPGDAQPAPVKDLRNRVGLMAQDIHPVPGLTVREQVAYAGWLRGLSTRAANNRAAELIDSVGLATKAGESAGHLSGGQLRRVGLAQALVSRPEVLLLDEPTAGLDPAQRARFRSILTGLPADLPLLVSTHQVDDIADLYDEVLVIRAGRVVFQGPPVAFHGQGSAEQAYLDLVGGADA